MLRVFSALLGLSFVLQSCLVPENPPYSALPPGPWRATLSLVDNTVTPNPKGKPLPEKLNLKFEEVLGGELPFIFEVKYVNKDSFYLEIINGEERIVVDNIKMARDKSQAKDTIYIDFPVFDSYITGYFLENMIAGEWVVRNKLNYRIPFVARHGKDYRFTTLRKTPVMDVSGRWDATFDLNFDETFRGVGEFVQKGNHLSGTFLTETGDYRYLEGTIQANKFYLSCFDGSHAFLFEGKVDPQTKKMIGSFRSGNHYQSIWEAKFNPRAKLPSADSLTTLVGNAAFSFNFPDAEGKMVSLLDEEFRNKPKIIQIMGTWCPNCRDETEFLINYLQKHPDLDLQVIALSFERYPEAAKASQALRTYQKAFNLPYPILWAGSSNKAEASKALPMLSKVMAFPTMVFLDRNNRVIRIHTGFSGPATSEYKSFSEEFDRFVQRMSNTKL
jgi:thiol-disulfide isomerase/thioredoxin